MVAITQIHVAGFETCQFTQKAKAAAIQLAEQQPELFSFEDKFTFETRKQYKSFLASEAIDEPFADCDRALEHTACPFVWMNMNDFIGGSKEMMAFTKKRVGEVQEKAPAPAAEPVVEQTKVELKVEEPNPLAETVKMQGERIAALESELALLKKTMLDASSLFAAVAKTQTA